MHTCYRCKSLLLSSWRQHSNIRRYFCLQRCVRYCTLRAAFKIAAASLEARGAFKVVTAGLDTLRPRYQALLNGPLGYQLHFRLRIHISQLLLILQAKKVIHIWSENVPVDKLSNCRDEENKLRTTSLEASRYDLERSSVRNVSGCTLLCDVK